MRHDGEKKSPSVTIPREKADQLSKILGFDINSSPNEDILRVSATLSHSRSVSPYTSAEMLEEYVAHGMPDVKDRILETIDEERRWRHAREEKEQNHQHQRELTEDKIRVRAQLSALILGVLGIISSLLASYCGVASSVCIAVALVAIGGVPVAKLLTNFVK